MIQPRTFEEVKKLLADHELDSYYESLKSLMRPRIDLLLEPKEDNEIEMGQSKIGGAPDLSEEISWPISEMGKPLSFIAQINCKDIASFDSENLLPQAGLLLFFYDADQEIWGFDPKDKDRFRVIFIVSTDNLKRATIPANLNTYSIYKSNELKFDKSLSFPGYEHHSIEGLISDEDFDAYLDISMTSSNQVLGYANCIQGPMEIECQLVTNGLYCGDQTGWTDPRRKELEPGKTDWILLLQLDSEEDKTGMMWGDCGKLYFWIRKDDLRNLSFDKCWCILQCS